MAGLVVRLEKVTLSAAKALSTAVPLGTLSKSIMTVRRRLGGGRKGGRSNMILLPSAVARFLMSVIFILPLNEGLNQGRIIFAL